LPSSPPSPRRCAQRGRHDSATGHEARSRRRAPGSRRRARPLPPSPSRRPAMLDKVVASAAEALADVQDGATILIGGFGIAGIPTELVCALLDQGARELTIVNNNGGDGPIGLSQLIAAGRVRKLVSSYARSVGKTGNAQAFADAWKAGTIELECVPQGLLAERMRAAAAGNGPFFTPTGYGTLLAEGKETRVIDGRGYVLEQPLAGD